MKIIYRANDGREFDNEKDALYHDETLQMLGDVLERLHASDNTEQEIYKLLRDDGLNIPEKEDNTPKKKELQLDMNPQYCPEREFTEKDTKHWIVIFDMEQIGVLSNEDADRSAAQGYALTCEVYDLNLCTWVYRGDYSQVVDFLFRSTEQCDEIISKSISKELLKKLNKEYYGY